MKTILTIFCLFSLCSVSFGQTEEETASRLATAKARSHCTDAKYDAEIAQDQTFLAQTDAATARTMCTDMEWLQVGDLHFMEGSLQSAEGDAKMMSGGTSESMGFSFRNMADTAWNAGNFAGAKTLYDMATPLFNAGKTAYEQSLPFYGAGKGRYEDAKEAYENGQ